MKPIEDRLRDAALAAARTVPDDGASPLRLPARRPGPAWRPDLHGMRGRLLAFVAPAAAATAAAGVLAGVVVAHGHVGNSGLPPARSVTAPRVPPRYLVALHYTGVYKGWKRQLTDAVIASSATGRVLGTVAVPHGYNSFVQVTGAYDDRTFVLAAQKIPPPATASFGLTHRPGRSGKGAITRNTGRATKTSKPRGPGWPSTRLYELRFRVVRGELAALRLTPLTGISLPPLTFGDMALSPDGTQLAVDRIWTLGTTRVEGLRVYDLATGGFRSWSLPGGDAGVFPFEDIAGPSWEANGRFLALTVSSGRCNYCVRLLDTASQAATVQGASRIIVRPPVIHSQWVDWTTTLLSPDGRRVLRSVTICVPSGKNECYDVAHVYGYSARSGRRLLALSNRAHNVEVDLMWLNPGGTHFVFSELAEGSGPPFITTFGFTPGGLLSRMPLPPQTVDAAW